VTRGSTVAALTLAASLGSGCRQHAEPVESAKRHVRCAAARAMTIADGVELRGTISPMPDRDAQVAAQVAGRILKVLVREGDVVAAGQVVARIDSGPLADDAQAAQAALAKARAEVKNAEATAARVQRVFEHGIAARQEVDDAMARAAAARATQEEADAAARRAQRQLDRAAVPSPMSGVVIRLIRRSGELVDGTPATPIVEIADPSRLELDADAAASDLVRLQPGQPADVTVAALPTASWKGKVAVVSPAVDRATGLGTVRVPLELGEAPRPPIGLLGTARVQVSAARTVVGVPSAAVRSGAGAEAEIVLCGADGLAHVRRVSRGVSKGGLTEAEGLTAGQAVVVEPVIGVAEGEALEIER
jgi:RND family efflux transporter MFP subunit